MVNLAKIRKKAKSGAPPTPAAHAGEVAGAPQSPDQKLQSFLATAGHKRAGIVQEAIAPRQDAVELLTFTLGDERYAIEIGDIAEIVSAQSATRIPNVEAGIVGVISVRGSIVTLVDVRSRLKQPARLPSKDSRVIVVRKAGGLVGFQVDRVLRPAKIERATIEPQPVVHPDEESECIRGVIRGPNALTIVLDLSKLVG
ncbi:MAG TPA: chemotaxis protein CheW [Thermoanaerobaculia bacterium]|nr:chemotaxis protein CheW [Thermoanaerobaculia bacterium]